MTKKTIRLENAQLLNGLIVDIEYGHVVRGDRPAIRIESWFHFTDSTENMVNMLGKEWKPE